MSPEVTIIQEFSDCYLLQANRFWGPETVAASHLSDRHL